MGRIIFEEKFSFTDYFRNWRSGLRPSVSHVTWKWCWRTFLPRCWRTFGFRESIKRRGAHSRKFHFRDGFQALLPDAAGLSIYPRARGSLSRTWNSIFHADSNENPKVWGLDEMSSIGDWTSRPNSSSFAVRWFRSNGFPCNFSEYFFFYLWNAISNWKLVSDEYFRRPSFIMEFVTVELVLWLFCIILLRNLLRIIYEEFVWK